MQPRSPPYEPAFSCPVCMGPFVEETSTKCGHIFCKACVKQSIAAQGKRPTCMGPFVDSLPVLQCSPAF